MQITDEFYIAISSEDLHWALDKLQHDDRVDWRSIRADKTTNGCTPIYWRVKK